MEIIILIWAKRSLFFGFKHLRKKSEALFVVAGSSGVTPRWSS
jgi:hypothetical protein